MKILNTGVQAGVINESPTALGTTRAQAVIQSDAVMATLFVTSVTGTLDVSVYAVLDPQSNTKKRLLFSFPTMSAATSNLIILTSPTTTATVLVEAVYSDACEYEVQLRAIAGDPQQYNVFDNRDGETAALLGVKGGLHTVGLIPRINLVAGPYLEERLTEEFTSGTGSSATVADNSPGHEYRVTSGTTVGGYGVIRSRRAMRRRAGIGHVARWDARFTASVAQSIQRAGLFNIGNEITVGYDNLLFGLLHRTGGRPEIRTLTVNTPTAANADVTITLNGVGTVVAIVSGTAAANAYTIGAATYTGWTAYSVGATVIFQSGSVNAQAGAFTAVPNGGAFVGTFARTAAGTAVVDTWHYQTAWNNPLLDSSSTFVLDPTKGNTYQVSYQVGYGVIKLFVENPATGRFLLVHTVGLANAVTTPAFDIPDFKLGLIAASAGTTTSLSVSSSFFAGFHEGTGQFPHKIHGQSGTVNTITSSLTNVLALKHISTSSGALDIVDTQIHRAAVAGEATKPFSYEIRLNPTFSTATNWTSIDEDTTMVYSTGGTLVTAGELLYSGALGKSSSIEILLTNLDVILSVNDVISIAARVSSGNLDAAASFVWSEV